jgi:hypothetical protein
MIKAKISPAGLPKPLPVTGSIRMPDGCFLMPAASAPTGSHVQAQL